MENLQFTDEELITRYLEEGNEKFFVELVNRYLKQTYNFVKRFGGSDIDAEEIVQESFVKLWKNIGRFRKGEKFKTWFFTIARNTAIDFLRKKRHVPFSYFDSENGGNMIEDTAESDLVPADILSELAENKKFFEDIIEDLPVQYKQVLFLYYNEEMGMDEISKVLKKPINTVKSQHRRALILLRKHPNAPKFNH